MIDRQTIDRIFAAANIVEVVGDYVTLKRKGVNYQACCPFHNEKTPSFVVSPAKGYYKCFGCGAGGNAVNFVMQYESMTYPEALRHLAKRYNIEVAEKELTPEDKERNNLRESMFALNGWAFDYFKQYMSTSDEGRSVGLSYFRQSRGMTEAIIERFGLGFCPSKGDTLSRAAMEAGYRAEALLATGLSLQSERDNSLRDRFRDRVIFPIHNISGRIVGFGGRTLSTEKRIAKYQNSPESEIYSKKRELYGLYFAKRAIQQNDAVIMVEGYTDVISMHQAGIENVVSSSGTSLTVEQVRLLSRFTKNITVIYDGDAAGVKAAIRGIDIILREGMNVRIVSLPTEHDPDSFARSHSAEHVQDYIRSNEEDFLSFKAKILSREAQSDPIKKAEMIADMVESISQIPDQIRRSVFARECSRIMDIDETLLLSEIGRKVAMAGAIPKGNDGGATLPPPAIEDFQRVTPVPQNLSVGSSVEVLESELLKYLLKHGHQDIDIIHGAQVNSYNVASLIFAELEDGGLRFSNDLHATLFDMYHDINQQLGEGVEVPISRLLSVEDAAVSNRCIDILTADENHVPSKLWLSRKPHENEDAERLTNGITKSLMLYKSKALDTMIKNCMQRLSTPLNENQLNDLLREIDKLNSIKQKLANHLKRVNL